MCVWRDIPEQASMMEKRRRWQGVRVLGVDGLYPRLKGRKRTWIAEVKLQQSKGKEIIPKEWRWVLEDIRRLPAELPPEGSRRLFELWKQTLNAATVRLANARRWNGCATC